MSDLIVIQPTPLDQVITLWLHEQFSRSQSEATLTAYSKTITSFRLSLQRLGLDLDTPQVELLATAAQGWASQRKAKPATVAQRLGILSSFYQFARRRRVLSIDNPIDLLERPRVQSYSGAQPLSAEAISQALEAINTSEPAGDRDYHLLLVGFSTGRRLSELAGLRTGHITVAGTSVTLRWPRCKGNKSMTDTLPPAIGQEFAGYLGRRVPNISELPPDSPVWTSFSDRNVGEAITGRTIARICQARLGTGKSHTLRHSFAQIMIDAQATVLQLSAKLGHANLGTTQTYIQRLTSATNPVAAGIDQALLRKNRS